MSKLHLISCGSLLVLFGILLLGILEQGHAYVRTTNSSGNPIFQPNATATVNSRLGCPTGRCFDRAVQVAAQAWNAAGARFSFTVQSPSRTATLACESWQEDDFVTVLFSTNDCGTAFDSGTLAVTISWVASSGAMGDSDILLNTAKTWGVYTGPRRGNTIDIQRIVLHELGHVLGLAHPDEYGQSVSAIMYSTDSDLESLQPDDKQGAVAIYGAAQSNSSAGALENPGAGTIQSGIGIISGWKCRAGRITVRIDGGAVQPVSTGVPRADTRSVCGGTTNNGFITQVNWMALSQGNHRIVAYDDGVQFASATFAVATTGVEFLRGATGSGSATLSNGQRATLRWSESTQSFVATQYTAGRTPEEPEPPDPPTATGLAQFVGTWRFTNRITTQTYRFPRVEPCRGNAAEQCLYDTTQNAVLGLGEVAGYSYALLHADTGICRGYFFYEPTGGSIRGHYGYGDEIRWDFQERNASRRVSNPYACVFLFRGAQFQTNILPHFHTRTTSRRLRDVVRVSHSYFV